METILFHLTTIATLAVLVVLVCGLYVMMRGKSPNLSQKLMRWRVGLQFTAIMLVLAYVLVRQYF
ncbi:MAG TPA: twin transmembrane helix small protein [Hyphomicrobium sp.]|nr:twin transmembrane helix small protein [Hyphomicrobium sp.]HRO51067.1 twin transmembrane helix small protein [Hyphomicrobium sp.]